MISAQNTRSLARRATAVAAGTLALSAVSVALAGPASAGVPEGWAPEDEMSWGLLWVLILAVPAVCFVVVSLLVLLPGVMRGEGLLPKPPAESEHRELEQGSSHH